MLLTDLARATDPVLRARAREVAGRLLLPLARHADRTRAPGARRFGPHPRGIDLDLDATLERRAEHPRLLAEDLRWQGWHRPGRAYVLVVDASGSTSGRPLATAVVTAAAVAARLSPGDELAVVAFWSIAVVLRPLLSLEPPVGVLGRLFDLRGGDTTDLAGGLRVSLAQAVQARGSRRDLIVLTDGMANEGDDPLVVAASAPASGCRVHVLAVSDAPEAVSACEALADAGDGRAEPLPGPGAAPAALERLLGRP